MKSEAKTVDAYFDEVPEDRRPVLERLRGMVRETAPVADENMDYGMPTYLIEGEMLCAFASQKANIAFYLCETDIVAANKAKLKGASCGKSCIRYRKPDAVDVGLLQKMLREAVERR